MRWFRKLFGKGRCPLGEACIFAAEAASPPDLSDPHACDACRERYRTVEGPRYRVRPVTTCIGQIVWRAEFRLPSGRWQMISESLFQHFAEEDLRAWIAGAVEYDAKGNRVSQ